MKIHTSILLATLTGWAIPASAPTWGQDVVTVTLGPEAVAALQDAPPESRLILFLTEGRLSQGEPADGPFPFQPTPLMSWALDEDTVEMDLLKGSLEATSPTAFYPVTLDDLTGTYQLQAVIDLPSVEPGHRAPGDLFGPPTTVELFDDDDDAFTVTIDEVRGPTPLRNNLVPVAIDSELLPDEFGTTAQHRAWVALPKSYNDINAKRRSWPTIFFIPDHGDPAESANTIADLLGKYEAKSIMPQAIWVILDPRSPAGHHYFTDSPTNGSRSRAFIEEFLPWLEIRFRMIPQSNARLLYGIGAGGRAALNLLADHPDIFSRTSAIAPEAISFNALGSLNLYKDSNGLRTGDDILRPATRSPLGPDRDQIHATIQDEVLTAYALNPSGYSGTPRDAMRAAFGSTFEPNKAPPSPFDIETGVIDRQVVSGWRRHDLILRALEERRFNEQLRKYGHVVVGERDQWYREQGVDALQAVVGTSPPTNDPDAELTGIIEIMPKATNNQAAAAGRLRVFDAMIKHLREQNLHD